jgi:transposase
MTVSKLFEGLIDLQRLCKREKLARNHVRLRAVIMAIEGRDAPTIAGALGVGRRSVQTWIERFNQGGAAALPDRPRSGQPRILTPAQEEEVCRWLDESLSRGPTDGQPILRGPQIRERIEEHFGAKMSLSGAYALLHRLGYEPLRPRPRHPKADADKQQSFKQSAPLLSSDAAAKNPRRSSKSGSRTRPASDSRAR